MNKLLQRRYCIPIAAWDIFSNVLSPSAWSRLCHVSRSSLRIPEDFFGINVASSEDDRCDEYVIARLRELGINNVRLAFSYRSFDSSAARFLEKLLDNRFVVTLVVLPPLDRASQMLVEVGVQEEWRRFVAEVFNRYERRVAVFEIGSTPNRKRWSGFRPRSYLKAWELACDAAKDHSVCLAGPNIQDFEPVYNAAVLFAMGRLSRVPEIHTNNLFVERVVEPEAYDHRVLGRWATNLLKLNLTKKARLLQYLGQKAGCRRTISTCNFWTTKRLSRKSRFPQDKKVDYLVRYLVLAATSDALGRVYWGPMICSRDGLIDDRAEGYPEVDHSSFYRSVRGDVDDFIVTPAFFALGYVAQRLKSARCDEAVSAIDGLNHFAFTGAGNEIFHVCWCRDGQAVSLTDVYSDEQLAAAVFTDACGKTLSSPLAINERPLFIDFPQRNGRPLQNHPPEAVKYDSDVVYACLPELRGVPWKNRDWRGAFTMTARLTSPALGDELAPEKIAARPELEVMRDRRNRLWNIAHPLDRQQRLTVKLNRPRGIKRLTYRFKPSKGRRHWNTASIMLQRGISTPTPVAYYERYSRSGIRASYYICEFVPDTFSSRHVCAAIREGLEEFKGLDKHQWFDLLTGFICRMHNSGIQHRDLSVGNLMLRQADGRITPYLIDIGRARVVKSTLAGHQRILDLMRICYKLDWSDRKLFIQAYCKSWGQTFPPYWKIALGYYDFKQGTKKYIKGIFRKRRPSSVQTGE